MTKEVVHSINAAPAAGPYSQAVRQGPFLFISGQLPIDPVSGVMPESVEAQTRLSLVNVSAILETAGGNLSNVLKTTVFLKDMDEFSKMNAIYGEHFLKDPPARSTIEVARLPRDAKVEIEAIAYIEGSTDV
ncbi:RidA family protein [Agrobacterium pusense]|uniref:RidA family protein n=1 Tax=Agrobacterium pusense TaxID=648995 RepID=UPI000D1BA81B|nr:Rid family detoxifying hydrolase [Agrobacterium pusense]